MQLACLDGALVPLSEARIPVTDPGLLRGDGVFEVMRVYDGVPFARDSHLQRLTRSARNLRLQLDADALARDVDALLEAARPAAALLRVLATRGGHRVALLEPLPQLPAELALGCVTYAPVRVLDGIKSLSYAANMLATRLAHERGFDDALLVTPHGRLLELPTASFFWVRDGVAHTPPLSEHILDSITRRAVVETLGAIEADATLGELERAEEAFAASSVLEVLGVARVESLELPVEGPVTAAAAHGLRERIAADCAAAQR